MQAPSAAGVRHCVEEFPRRLHKQTSCQMLYKFHSRSEFTLLGTTLVAAKCRSCSYQVTTANRSIFNKLCTCGSGHEMLRRRVQLSVNKELFKQAWVRFLCSKPSQHFCTDRVLQSIQFSVSMGHIWISILGLWNCFWLTSGRNAFVCVYVCSCHFYVREAIVWQRKHIMLSDISWVATTQQLSGNPLFR